MLSRKTFPKQTFKSDASSIIVKSVITSEKKWTSLLSMSRQNPASCLGDFRKFK